ncbi:MAG: hypothetical protein ACI8S6_002791 [Myxococcota bacterium]|jgi:hypothetical protein
MLPLFVLLSACLPKDGFSEPDAPMLTAAPVAGPVVQPEPEPVVQPEPEPVVVAEPVDLGPLAVEVPDEGMEKRRATRRLTVYRSPTTSSKARAILNPDATFAVIERVDGPGCSREGWASVPGDGYVCLDHTEPSTEPLYLLPELVEFVHPAPTDWETYSTEGTYNTEPSGRPVRGLVPFVYAKVWRTWRGPVYASADAYARGDRAVSRMGSGKKFRFVEAIETEKGTVLERPNGSVIPSDEIFLYPISYFHGRELDSDPIPAGMLPAWVFGYEGGSVRAEPSMSADVVTVLDYHEPLWVRDAPVDKAGHWWEIPDALGAGVPGYVNDQVDIRHWVPREAPSEVLPGELWVDVDLGQQVLALMEGDSPTFVTLVSTGDVGWSTPQGIYRIYDKMIDTTMASRVGPEEEDYYFVEGVPWTMHFRPRYALHGVFWHWGFGHRASHGCVNLAPRDAQYVFDRVGPTMQAGWHTGFETPSDPGTVMRIRSGDSPVNDRRASLR